jgi:hypothetical protein
VVRFSELHLDSIRPIGAAFSDRAFRAAVQLTSSMSSAEPKPCEKTMTGSELPVVGAEILTCRSSPRPGASSTTGFTETTGVGAVTAKAAARCEATPELLDWLSAERDRIDRQIGDLASARDRLDTVIANATVNWRTGQHCRPR